MIEPTESKSHDELIRDGESDLDCYLVEFRRNFPILNPAMNRLSFRYVGNLEKLITFDGRVVQVSQRLLIMPPKQMFIMFTHVVMHYLFHHIGRLKPFALSEKNRRAANLAMDLMANRCISSIDERGLFKLGGRVVFPEGMPELEKVIHPEDLEILEQGLTTETLYEYILNHFDELEDVMEMNPTKDDLIITEESPDMNDQESAIARGVWNNIASGIKRGDGTLDSIRNIEDYPEVHTNYKEELKEFMISRLSNHFISSFSRLSRRTLGQFGLGILPPIQPGSIPEKNIRRACIVVDTSASVDDELLKELMSNVSEVQQQTGCNLYLIFCDSCIKAEYEVEDNLLDLVREGTVQIKGGGGTSFVPAQKRMMELGDGGGIDDIDVGIYFTDGEGQWLDKRDFPLADRLIWVLTPINNWLDSKGKPTGRGPDYGKIIQLERYK